MKITDKTMPTFSNTKQRAIPTVLGELGIEFRKMHGQPLVAKAVTEDTKEGSGSLPRPNFPKGKATDHDQPCNELTDNTTDTAFKVAFASLACPALKNRENVAVHQASETTTEKVPVPKLKGSNPEAIVPVPNLPNPEIVAVPKLKTPEADQIMGGTDLEGDAVAGTIPANPQTLAVPNFPNLPNPETMAVPKFDATKPEQTVTVPNLEDATVAVPNMTTPDLSGLVQPQKPTISTSAVPSHAGQTLGQGEQAPTDSQTKAWLHHAAQTSSGEPAKATLGARDAQTMTQIDSKELPDGLLPEVATTPSQTAAVATKPTVSRPSLNELADRIAKHILTSAPGEAKPEVRIQLKESVMPQTQLQLVREDGYLTVRVVTASGETHGMLREQLQGLRHQLENRLGESVQMELRFQGEDGDGRSKGYFRYEEEMEGAL